MLASLTNLFLLNFYHTILEPVELSLPVRGARGGSITADGLYGRSYLWLERRRRRWMVWWCRGIEVDVGMWDMNVVLNILNDAFGTSV